VSGIPISNQIFNTGIGASIITSLLIGQKNAAASEKTGFVPFQRDANIFAIAIWALIRVVFSRLPAIPAFLTGYGVRELAPTLWAGVCFHLFTSSLLMLLSCIIHTPVVKIADDI
jgi:hypothetical protein